MPEIHTEKLGKHPEQPERRMSSVAEASMLLRELAEPPPIGDKVKAAINRAAKLVSAELKRMGEDPMTPGRAEDIWRQEKGVRVNAEELDAARAAKQRRREARDRDRARDAVAAIRSLRDRYAETDPAFFREQILALEQALRDARRHIPEILGGDQTGLSDAPAGNGAGE